MAAMSYDDPSPDDPHPPTLPFYDDEAEVLERRPPEVVPEPYFTRHLPPGPYTAPNVVAQARECVRLWESAGSPDSAPILAIGDAEADVTDLLSDAGAAAALVVESVGSIPGGYLHYRMSDEEFDAMFDS